MAELTFRVKAMIRCYHVYECIWTAVVHQGLGHPQEASFTCVCTRTVMLLFSPLIKIFAVFIFAIAGCSTKNAKIYEYFLLYGIQSE